LHVGKLQVALDNGFGYSSRSLWLSKREARLTFKEYFSISQNSYRDIFRQDGGQLSILWSHKSLISKNYFHKFSFSWFQNFRNGGKPTMGWASSTPVHCSA
jgi:hypothetical protein